MYSNTELLTICHKERAKVFEKFDILQESISFFTTCYKTNLDTLTLIQTWLRFTNIPPAIARRLHALGAFVEASLQRLEGRVLETMRTLELMKVELTDIEALIREVEGDEVEEAENEEDESEDDDFESIGDWGVGAEDAVDEDDQDHSVEGTESGSGEEGDVGGM